MKNITLTFLSIIITLVVYSQNSVNADSCIVIKPDWESGADAVLHGLSSEVNTNYGTQSQFCANAWTFVGTSGTVRSVIDFHIQNWIPVGAQITSASLKLYGLTVSGYGFGQHSPLSGSNACWLERVTSQWDENTVTWNTQPQTTIQNRVSMSQSTVGNQVYSMNVTQLIIDMLQNSISSYGFMIRLKNEQHYRRMNFYSSDYIIDSLRPELKICFIRSTIGISQEINKLAVNIFPNPVQDILNIKISNFKQGAQLKLFDIAGRLLMEKSISSEQTQINVANLAKGVYIVEIQTGKLDVVRQKIMIQP